MRRFLRRAFIIVLLLLCLLAISAWIVRGKALARPAWYSRLALDPEFQRAAATSAEQKLIEGFASARRAQAAEVRALHAHPDAPATEPADPIQLEFSEDELNASLNKWKDFLGWKGSAGRYVQEPMIVLDQDAVLLAATIDYKGMSIVASLRFTPRLEDGKLDIGLGPAMAGTLPIPQSFFAAPLKQWTDAIEGAVSEAREKADIGPRGWANNEAVDAAMGELLLHALRHEPAEAALFFREPDGGHDARNLPVRIISIEIGGKVLRLTVQPMNAEQRETLLRHIRGDLPGGTPAP